MHTNTHIHTHTYIYTYTHIQTHTNAPLMKAGNAQWKLITFQTVLLSQYHSFMYSSGQCPMIQNKQGMVQYISGGHSFCLEYIIYKASRRHMDDDTLLYEQ